MLSYKVFSAVGPETSHSSRVLFVMPSEYSGMGYSNSQDLWTSNISNNYIKEFITYCSSILDGLFLAGIETSTRFFLGVVSSADWDSFSDYWSSSTSSSSSTIKPSSSCSALELLFSDLKLNWKIRKSFKVEQKTTNTPPQLLHPGTWQLWIQ